MISQGIRSIAPSLNYGRTEDSTYESRVGGWVSEWVNPFGGWLSSCMSCNANVSSLHLTEHNTRNCNKNRGIIQEVPIITIPTSIYDVSGGAKYWGLFYNHKHIRTGRVLF